MANYGGYPYVDDELTGGKGNDSLYGDSGNDLLKGGKGKDTIRGGKDDDTLTGGAGADTFIYSIGDGNDTITDYEESDVIKFESGTPKFSTKGNNVILTVGTGNNKGTITLQNAKGKTITYLDAKNVEYTWPKEIEVNDAVTKVTILDAYSKDSFKIADYGADYTGVKTIDASAVQHDMSITGNDKANGIVGTEEDDYIDGGKGKDTILGGDGNDTLVGGKGNDNLTGGAGKNVFVYNNGDGDDVITDYKHGDIIKINSGTISSTAVLNGNDYVFTTGNGSITVKNSKNKYIQVVDANNKGWTYVSGKVTLNKKYRDDSFDVSIFNDFAGVAKTIDASAVTHDMSIIANKQANRIVGTEEDDYIDGGAGKDTILGGDGNDTIIGGKGNDSLSGGEGKNVFVYNDGDGNDVITDFKQGDVIQIASGKVPTVAALDGKDYVFTIGKGTITVKNAKDKYIKLVDAKDNAIWYPEVPDEVGYTYSKSKVTINKKYIKDTFDVAEFDDFAGSVETIDAAKVPHELTIIGNKKANRITGTEEDDYIDGGAGKDTLIGGDGNDTLVGGKGNDSLKGGDGDDVFVYTNGDGNDVITDFTNDDSIVINKDTVTKYAKSGKNMVLTLASKGKLTITGGADKVIHYADSEGDSIIGQVVTYNKKGTAATLTEYYDSDSYAPSDYSDYASLATIDASAVNHALNITGNKKANKITGTEEDDYIDGGKGADTLLGGKGKDTLTGGAGDDILTGGKGNDSLAGGSGDDIFVYTKGDGNDVIADYAEGDKISIKSDTVKNFTTAKNGKDIIFTLASESKITIQGGADKAITYFEGSKEKTYGTNSPVRYNDDYTAATLTSAYESDSFSSSDYSSYASSLVTINASAVEHEINITGSKLANSILGSENDDYIDGGKGKDTLLGGDGDDTVLGGDGNDVIYGGKGDDSLWGGQGTDTLWGGEGEDTFVYQNGDGKVTIADFVQGETIRLLSGKVGTVRSTSGGDVTFEIGSGQLTVSKAADKYIELIDSSGNQVSRYSPKG